VPRFLGYKVKNSPVLAGLSDTDYSYHGGLSIGWSLASVRLNAQLLTDLLGESDGSEFVGTLSKSYTIGGLSLTPALSLNWQDSTLVDHYYGINADQATDQRAQYRPDAALNVALALTASYPITHSLDLIGTARVDQYGSAIEDSPIVDNNRTTSTSVGLIYSF